AVDLPLAVPVVAAGLRVAAVSNVSMVSVAALIGVSQLGSLFTDGFNRNAMGPIVVGVLASVVLPLLLDATISLLARLLTPWLRRRCRHERPRPHLGVAHRPRQLDGRRRHPRPVGGAPALLLPRAARRGSRRGARRAVGRAHRTRPVAGRQR